MGPILMLLIRQILRDLGPDPEPGLHPDLPAFPDFPDLAAHDPDPDLKPDPDPAAVSVPAPGT
jgi:hypothetical protein